jgi:pimeloyl-ACP methyl ester carboxylesterase
MSETDMSAAFGALRQVDAGLLNVGYAEAGPAAGTAVILLHGWPYGIGHNLPQEAPQDFAQAVIDVAGF